MSAGTGFSLLTTRRFGFLCLAQFLGVFSDNFAKSAIAVLLLFGGGGDSVAAAVATALFILPYALFAPLAGRVADRFPKHQVARIVKLIELPVMLVAGAALWSGSSDLMLASMFLAGMQATLFSPVKYGILPELVEGQELVSANAFVEGGTFLAILAGTIAGGLAGGFGPSSLGVIVLAASSGFGAIATFCVPRTRITDRSLSLSLVPFAGTRQLMRSLSGWRRTHAAAVALSWFWMAGAVMLAEIPAYAREVLNAGANGATILLAALATGIGAGSLAYGAIARRRSAGAAIPFGFVGMAAATACAAGISATGTVGLIEGAAALFAAAFCGGLLSVPLYVALQEGAPAEARARAVSGNNLLNAIYMVIGSAGAAAIGMASHTLGLGPDTTVRLVLAGAAIASAFAALPACLNIPEAALAVFGRLLLLVYRVEVRGLGNLAKAGPSAVIAPNHVTWIDGALLAAALPGRPAFAVNTFTARKWWARWAIGMVEALPVDPANPMAIKTLIREVRSGRQCVMFPEGRLTRTGSLMKIYDGPAVVADKAEAPVIPVRIDGAHQTFWSRLRGVYRRRMFPKITITILPPARLAVSPALVGQVRREALSRALYDTMSNAAFRSFEADRTLFGALLDAASDHGGREIIEDMDRSPMSYSRLVTASLVLGRKLARHSSRGDRVGVLLPNAAGCVVTMFGLQAFGRVPAMLNYSTGAENMAAALKAACISTVVTSRRFVELGKLELAVARLAETAKLVYLEDLRAEIGGLARLRGLVDRVFARRLLRKSGQRPCDPALVLFTSGSEGTPKGVVLSHRNLLANAGQAAARVAFNPNDVVLNALPVFHSFGMTAGLLLPLLSGIRTVLYPNPLHYRRIPELAYDAGATILFGTDTFLAGYARKAHPYDFHTLRYVFAGAERVRAETKRIWADKFGVRILEGYGATETGPVLAINTPMHAKDGTVGHLLPSITARLEPVPGIERGGRLFVSGPNIMLGYLKATLPGVIEAPAHGWYDTGDIVEIDEAGYLTILGRARRFAKVAGEMVSLAAVEEWAAALWPDDKHAAVALSDARKGERIMLLSTRPGASRADIATYMRGRGLPEVATPSEIVYVPEVPVLGTGKTDYTAVRDIASRPRVTAAA
jgi:acyl-[acyl-carrier-protein]-phospholipid O-acyltransferase/long-chain-fatty-acid--[acyl-carrier-protein] ligase